MTIQKIRGVVFLVGISIAVSAWAESEIGNHKNGEIPQANPQVNNEPKGKNMILEMAGPQALWTYTTASGEMVVLNLGQSLEETLKSFNAIWTNEGAAVKAFTIQRTTSSEETETITFTRVEHPVSEGLKGYQRESGDYTFSATFRTYTNTQTTITETSTFLDISLQEARNQDIETLVSGLTDNKAKQETPFQTITHYLDPNNQKILFSTLEREGQPLYLVIGAEMLQRNGYYRVDPVDLPKNGFIENIQILNGPTVTIEIRAHDVLLKESDQG